MQIVKDIYLDFYQSEPVLVTAKEGDVGRFLHVTLLDNGNIFPVPSGSTVTFSRDDVWNGCTVNDDGTILAPITADMRPGRVPAQIEVSSGNDHLSSWNFILDVQNSARNDAAIEGNNDFSAIQTLLDQVQGAIDATNTAIANVNAAIANMGQNFASLANTQNITQLATNAKTLVGGINELNKNIHPVGFPLFAPGIANLDEQFFLARTKADPIGLPSSLLSNGCFVIQQNPENPSYNAQIAFSFGSFKIAMRIKSNMTNFEWSEWKYVTLTETS